MGEEECEPRKPPSGKNPVILSAAGSPRASCGVEGPLLHIRTIQPRVSPWQHEEDRGASAPPGRSQATVQTALSMTVRCGAWGLPERRRRVLCDRMGEEECESRKPLSGKNPVILSAAGSPRASCGVEGPLLHIRTIQPRVSPWQHEEDRGASAPPGRSQATVQTALSMTVRCGAWGLPERRRRVLCDRMGEEECEPRKPSSGKNPVILSAAGSPRASCGVEGPLLHIRTIQPRVSPWQHEEDRGASAPPGRSQATVQTALSMTVRCGAWGLPERRRRVLCDRVGEVIY